MTMPLHELNALDLRAFTVLLGGVFEHSPWVAERAWPRRPFGSVGALHEALCAEVEAAPLKVQLDLIRAHPSLAGRASVRGDLTPASRREQVGAGLDQCTPEELLRLRELNAAYETKFGFPFILAVRGHNPGSIIETLSLRLLNPPVEEHDEALRQIARIARYRLNDMIVERA